MPGLPGQEGKIYGLCLISRGCKDLERFGSSLENIRQKKSPYSEEVAATKGVNWVKPKYVGEVGFTEWTEEGRLRHPRFIGLRDDKKAENVVREK